MITRRIPEYLRFPKLSQIKRSHSFFFVLSFVVRLTICSVLSNKKTETILINMFGYVYFQIQPTPFLNNSNIKFLLSVWFISFLHIHWLMSGKYYCILLLIFKCIHTITNSIKLYFQMPNPFATEWNEHFRSWISLSNNS